MATVTISPKYQVVIPKDIREAMSIKAGERLEVFLLDGVLEYVPVKHPRELRGFVRGMRTDMKRDDEDRL
jgi:AbrB family looped-hinge helix DNA binding protein